MSKEEKAPLPDGYESSRLYKLYPALYGAVFVEKRSVLLSGSGGTGKSYALGLVKQEADRLGLNCALTGTTGVSAYSLGKGASTIYRWASIKLGTKPLTSIVKYIRDHPDKKKRWLDCHILAIDEVSMLPDNIFNLVSQVGQMIRLVKGNKSQKIFHAISAETAPFGGIQVILTGDFLQLSPIKGHFIFQSDLFTRLDLFCFRLIHPYRYPDIKFFELLSRIRVGKHTADDIKTLEGRVDAYKIYKKESKQDNSPLKLRPTRVYPLKADVEAINMSELESLEGDLYEYEAEDTILIKVDTKGKPLTKAADIRREEYAAILDELAPCFVWLKVGAQVMLTRNLDVAMGLVNGARGVVIQLDMEQVKVRFVSGLELDLTPYPYEFEDDRVIASRLQFPLLLAYAISCHKTQSMTLDCLVGKCGIDIFGPGMAYVLLSRCKTLEGLYLIDLMADKIQAHPEGLKFEEWLIEHSITPDPIKDETDDKKESKKEVDKTG